MSIAMPRVVQRPTVNYSPTPVRHDLVIVHRTEGGYEGAVAWLCDARARASAHLVMRVDGSEVTQLVPLSMKAWAQCAFNSSGVSLEIEGFTAQGMSDETMQAAAKIVAWLCHAYAIPCRHAAGGQGSGFTQHHDLGAAGGGHLDCFGVDDAEWRKFAACVQSAYDALAAGPLPAFALHGLPNPHLAELPPSAPREPSHGGAARAEPGDLVAHPTPTRFPFGSVADLQWRLNAAGAAPALAIDGYAGLLTRAALAAFQKRADVGCDATMDATTWRALVAATEPPDAKPLALSARRPRAGLFPQAEEDVFMGNFWVHLGAQIGMAAAGAAVTTAAGASYSNLGVWAGFAQAAAAILAEIYNQFAAQTPAVASNPISKP